MKTKSISEESLSSAVQGLKAIAHPARLKILCYLQGRESTVNEIVAMTGMSQSAVSQHLGKMRAYGVLVDRRDGNRVFYGLSDVQYGNLVDALCTIYDK